MLRFIVYTQISKNDHNSFRLCFTFIGFLCGIHIVYTHYTSRPIVCSGPTQFSTSLISSFPNQISYSFQFHQITLAHMNGITLLSCGSYFTPFEMYILIKIAAFIYCHIAVNRNLVTKYIEYLNTFSSILSILFHLFVFSFYFCSSLYHQTWRDTVAFQLHLTTDLSTEIIVGGCTVITILIIIIVILQ